MDLITQGAIGAAAAQCTSNRDRLKRAVLLGGFGGMLPDLDILIRSPTDPLLFLDFHRHFTHALAFIPIGGAIAAWLCAKLSRGRLSFRDAWLPCTIGYATHGLLDGCTSYGTYLFWPFSNTRVAWDIISIIDLLFTVPLLIGLWLTHRTGRKRWIGGALTVSLLYLCTSAIQHERALDALQSFAEARGHTPIGASAKPSFGNSLVFRSYYEHAGNYYVDAIRVGWLSPPKLYPGTTIPVFDIDAYVRKHGLDDTKVTDLKRFEHFSAGFLTQHPDKPTVIGDLRYAAVPNAVEPLWGIDVLTPPRDAHAAWITRRGFGRDKRQKFWDMLWGR